MLATPGLFHRHKGQKLLRHQIYIVMRHKIFEYSFTASLPGIISVKGLFFSHTVQVSVNIYIYFFFISRLMVTWNWNRWKQKALKRQRISFSIESSATDAAPDHKSDFKRERESEKNKKQTRGCGQSARSRCVFKSPVPREQWLEG